MTTYADSIATILTNNAPLGAVLTGGIHVYEDAGRKGINRVELVKAFSPQTGIIKPLCIIYEAQEMPTGEAIDAPSGYRSTRVPIMIWLYDEGEQGYANIDNAYHKIYTLLQGTPIPNGFQSLWVNTLKNKREPLLNDACYYQVNFNVFAFITA